MSPAGLTSFSSIAGKQATLEGPAVSTVKKAVKLYQVCPAVADGFPHNISNQRVSWNDVVSAADCYRTHFDDCLFEAMAVCHCKVCDQQHPKACTHRKSLGVPELQKRLGHCYVVPSPFLQFQLEQ